LDYWSNVAPNSAFAFPKGQAISRTTYATLFTAIGVAYGSGDGSTTFNLPDKMGRVSAMKEDSSTRLTGTYFGGTSTVLNAVGGSESQTMTLAQLPTGITSANASQAISVTSTSGQVWQGVNSNLIAGGGPNGVATIAGLVSTGNNSISVTSNNTSGTAHPIVQPTIICNYIMRII
jgi:microcystin-dependent protein